MSLFHMKFRIYADDSVVWEDDFEEHDNALPYYDDYGQHSISTKLLTEDQDHNDSLALLLANPVNLFTLGRKIRGIN
jgi:hypothetical protein